MCQSLFLSFLYATKWDVEYWQSLKWKNYENCQFKLYTDGQIRINKDLSRVYYYRISECVAYSVFPDLDVEAHYSFLYLKNRGATRFNNVQRMELEVNPSLPLNDCVSLRWRNRYELIKKQDSAFYRSVFRHRVLVQYKMEDYTMSASDEVFYDFKTHKFTQNRWMPLQINFDVKKMNLGFFFMLRNFYTSNKWYRSVVLGSEVNF